jgi:hypothetical protein
VTVFLNTSLKSATVRQAAQSVVTDELLLGLAVLGIARLLPASLIATLMTSLVVLIIMAALGALDAILLAAALASFRRARLVLH